MCTNTEPLPGLLSMGGLGRALTAGFKNGDLAELLVLLGIWLRGGTFPETLVGQHLSCRSDVEVASVHLTHGLLFGRSFGAII